jgi:uncharacterized protein
MATKLTHTPGTFCWAALGTSDADDAGRFYSELFGWTALTQVIHGVSSATFVQDGLPICAVFAMGDDLRKAGFPPNWVPYLSVASADESAAQIAAARGQMIEPPFDVPGAGRMAPFADPSDAKAAIWQSMGFSGAGAWGVNNALAWIELHTTNIDVAARFYSDAFGWQAKPLASHAELSIGGISVGGMKPLASGSGASPHWRTYFQVSDCDAAIEKALRLGAKVQEGPRLVPDLGRVVLLRDRQAATFALLQPTTARSS